MKNADELIIKMQGLLIERLCAGACEVTRLDAAQALRRQLGMVAGGLSGQQDERVAAWLARVLAALEDERA